MFSIFNRDHNDEKKEEQQQPQAGFGGAPPAPPLDKDEVMWKDTHPMRE